MEDFPPWTTGGEQRAAGDVSAPADSRVASLGPAAYTRATVAASWRASSSAGPANEAGALVVQMPSPRASGTASGSASPAVRGVAGAALAGASVATRAAGLASPLVAPLGVDVPALTHAWRADAGVFTFASADAESARASRASSAAASFAGSPVARAARADAATSATGPDVGAAGSAPWVWADDEALAPSHFALPAAASPLASELAPQGGGASFGGDGGAPYDVQGTAGRASPRAAGFTAPPPAPWVAKQGLDGASSWEGGAGLDGAAGASSWVGASSTGDATAAPAAPPFPQWPAAMDGADDDEGGGRSLALAAGASPPRGPPGGGGGGLDGGGRGGWPRQPGSSSRYQPASAGGAGPGPGVSPQLWTLQAIGPRLSAHARTQAGSKALQTALATGEPAVVAHVLERALADVHALITDNFGNYFVQALFRTAAGGGGDSGGSGAGGQRCRLLDALRPVLVDVACDRNGTYALQSIVDAVAIDAGAEVEALRRGLSVDPLRLATHPSGTHVLQRFARRFAAPQCGFVHDMVRAEAAALALHPNAVAFVLLALDGGDAATRATVVSLGLSQAPFLAAHPHGNYVLQHLLSRRSRELVVGSFEGAAEALAAALAAPSLGGDGGGGAPGSAPPSPAATPTPAELADLTLTAALTRRLRGCFVQLATHKYGSNVVEKCVVWGGRAERGAITRELFSSHALVRALLCDAFANYVVQTLLQTAPAGGGPAATAERAFLLAALEPNLGVFADGRTHASVHAKWVQIVDRLRRGGGDDDGADAAFSGGGGSSGGFGLDGGGSGASTPLASGSDGRARSSGNFNVKSGGRGGRPTQQLRQQPGGDGAARSGGASEGSGANGDAGGDDGHFAPPLQPPPAPPPPPPRHPHRPTLRVHAHEWPQGGGGGGSGGGSTTHYHNYGGGGATPGSAYSPGSGAGAYFNHGGGFAASPLPSPPSPFRTQLPPAHVPQPHEQWVPHPFAFVPFEAVGAASPLVSPVAGAYYAQPPPPPPLQQQRRYHDQHAGSSPLHSSGGGGAYFGHRRASPSDFASVGGAAPGTEAAYAAFSLLSLQTHHAHGGGDGGGPGGASRDPPSPTSERGAAAAHRTRAHRPASAVTARPVGAATTSAPSVGFQHVSAPERHAPAPRDVAAQHQHIGALSHT